MARVIVVGAGVVGTATGHGFRRHGHDVTLVDIDPEVVGALAEQGFRATVTLDLSGPSAYVFLALPTPAINGIGYDLSAFAAGVESVGVALRDAQAHHTVVVRSTVPPLTLDHLVSPILAQTSGRLLDQDFSVASAPEFLRAASAVEDFLSPWVTVIASRNRGALARLIELFDPLGGELLTFTDPAVAEFIKVVHNVFNAAKISFWNEMWQLCQALGIDADAVATTVARSAEGSFNPDYGIRGGSPFGGPCLPKDLEGMLGFARNLGVDVPLLRSVRQVNEAIAEQSARSGEPENQRTDLAGSVQGPSSDG